MPDLSRRFNLVNPNTGLHYLNALESAGYITRSGPEHFADPVIELTEKARRLRGKLWFFRGGIAAGELNESSEYREFLVDGIEDLCPEAREGDYFLRITGDSMIDAGIRPGQLALMRPGVAPKPGAICAIWVEGEGGTLKRLYVEEGRARLVPANATYAEMEYPVENIRVQGVLVAVISVTSFRNP